KALPTEPARVVDLYPQLYAGTFVVPVQEGSESDLGTAAFWIYPSTDGVRELPVFTGHDSLLANVPPDTPLIAVNGEALWPRLLELVRAEQFQVAVDPGQSHGIRVSKEVILGMLSAYGVR